MINIHHKPIKRFAINGLIYDESKIATFKVKYTNLLLSEMRFSGYALRLDIDPDFTISYNEETNFFSFELSVYGVYVGKQRVKWIIGIDGTRVISTAPNKSKEFLLGQESKLHQK